MSKNEAKRNSKWPTQKNWVFQLPPKAEQFLPKFQRLVLGLVGLNDAKGINATLPICKPKKGQKNTKPKDLSGKFWRKLLSFWWWLKNGHFEFLLHSYSNWSQFMGFQGFFELLMITLISSKKLGGYKIMSHTVIVKRVFFQGQMNTIIDNH